MSTLQKCDYVVEEAVMWEYCVWAQCQTEVEWGQRQKADGPGSIVHGIHHVPHGNSIAFFHYGNWAKGHVMWVLTNQQAAW